MNVMVIYDHPWDGSYNHAILEAVIKGLNAANHKIDILDLHKDGFDPVFRAEELALYSLGKYLDPKIGEYQARIMKTDHLIFIFPIWWQVMPAMLKGFLDKVLLYNWAYVDAQPTPIGKLTHIQGATVVTTMGVSNGYYRFVYRNTLKQVFLKGTLRFCGIKKTRWLNLGRVAELKDEQRKKWLTEIEIFTSDLRLRPN